MFDKKTTLKKKEEDRFDYLRHQFINVLMKKGKKELAEQLLDEAFVYIKKQGLNPRVTFLDALSHVNPMLTIVTKRRGRKVLHIPAPVMGSKRLKTGLRWIIEAMRDRSESKMSLRIANELIQMTEGQGKAIKAQAALYKQAYTYRLNIDMD